MDLAFWLVLGAVALLGEVMSMQLFLLNIAIAAFIVAPLSLVVVLLGQFVLFGVLALLLTGVRRPRLLHALM